MSDYLFLGGPANGQTREVEDDAPVTKYVSLPDAPSYATLTGRSVPQSATPDYGMAAVIHSYSRRELRVTQTETGREFTRVLYVHDESIPSAQHMTNALMGWLLGSWVMGGSEVITGEVVSVDDARADSGA